MIVTRFKDIVLLGLFFATLIILSPILIPLFLIDDGREENYYRRYM
jgi:hypothetical protein